MIFIIELFEKAPIPKAYFTLALPVVFGTVVSMIYNLTDTFFVAQTQNANLVAGITICTPLFSMMIALGDMFGLGGSSAISRLLGQRKYDVAGRVNSFCFYAALVMGVIVTICLFVFKQQVLGLLGVSQETYRYAAIYYQIMAAAGILIIVSLVPINTLRTEGLATQSMIGTASGTVFKIFLDPLFIFGFHLGAAGAALATVVGYLITDSILIAYTVRRARYIHINPHKMHIPGAEVKDVFMIGIPASVTNFMTMLGTALMNNFLIKYGADKVAGFGIATKVETIVTMVLVGFCFGSQALIGYNYGARNKERLKKIIQFDILVNAGFAFIIALGLIAIAPWLCGLFMKDQNVVHAASYMLRWFLTTTPFIGISLVFTTMFQSVNQPLDAFIMSISRQGFIFTIVIFIVASVMGYQGVIVSQPIADVITACIGLLLYWREFGPRGKVIQNW
ncbi:MATE family efflux transporter [Secundilactobacillus paracollinoides]|uniref:MATE family efflux transporter n=2 Tax=Secundilactobacillus paracollinoides TaxID=240427 RepID=UPI0006EF98D4|nr:Na+ driven multidrug efflux pump [Secundilactobacillus paracollinoides DSM 15502 = JCM 11969]